MFSHLGFSHNLLFMFFNNKYTFSEENDNA